MIYQQNQIVTTVGSSGVASVANIQPSEWLESHVYVQMNSPEFMGQINIGALPVVEIFEVSSVYEFQAEPEHQGTRTTEWVIRIIAPTFITTHTEKANLLQKLKVAIISALTKNLNIGATDIRVETPKIMPYSVYLDIRFTTETSHDHNFAEGT